MSVPHFFQSSPQTCGAACLRMLAQSLGLTTDESTLAAACNTTPVGCTVDDLVVAAKTIGFNAQLLAVRGRQAAIAALSHKVPFVAMIDVSQLTGGAMLQWHFVVPIELRRDTVMYHDPADGPDRTAALNDFLDAWAGYQGVQVWTP